MKGNLWDWAIGKGLMTGAWVLAIWSLLCILDWVDGDNWMRVWVVAGIFGFTWLWVIGCFIARDRVSKRIFERWNWEGELRYSIAEYNRNPPIQGFRAEEIRAIMGIQEEITE